MNSTTLRIALLGRTLQLGKREIYIPYNAYRLEDPKYTCKKMLQPGSINGEPIRYERHRVWVLEATLKEGYRHQYDEDIWIAVLAHNYDARGHLWRINMLNTYYAYDAKVSHAGMALLYPAPTWPPDQRGTLPSTRKALQRHLIGA